MFAEFSFVFGSHPRVSNSPFLENSFRHRDKEYIIQALIVNKQLMMA